jgi:plastocyanin
MSDHDRRPTLPPIAYPVLGVVFGGVLVWSFSRILLAVDKKQAAAIALLMALNILIGAALVAYGRRVRRRPASYPLLMGAGGLVIAAGILALNLGGPVETAQANVQHVTLVAEGVKFVQTKLSFQAGATVALAFDNKDSGVQHNFVLFNGANASAPQLFSGTVITGPSSTTYRFTAPPPGTYFFHCEIHPTQMTGTATVAPGQGGPGAALNLLGKGLKFAPTSLTAPQGAPQITIGFKNQDTGVPHNVVVFNGADASAPQLFRGDPVTGPGAVEYTFATPPPGRYFFHCEFHPTTMTGILTVP